jgi:hypothetical protein
MKHILYHRNRLSTSYGYYKTKPVQSGLISCLEFGSRKRYHRYTKTLGLSVFTIEFVSEQIGHSTKFVKVLVDYWW